MEMQLLALGIKLSARKLPVEIHRRAVYDNVFHQRFPEGSGQPIAQRSRGTKSLEHRPTVNDHQYNLRVTRSQFPGICGGWARCEGKSRQVAPATQREKDDESKHSTRRHSRQQGNLF
jgi:hypothetical protein